MKNKKKTTKSKNKPGEKPLKLKANFRDAIKVLGKNKKSGK